MPPHTYTITTQRGAYFSTENNAIGGTPDGTPSTFAFIPYEAEGTTRHYLYCVEKKAFVIHDASVYPDNVNNINNYAALSDNDFKVIADVQVVPSASPTGNFTASLMSGNLMFNLSLRNSTFPLVINWWHTPDEGNRVAIETAGDFSTADLAVARKILDDYFTTHKYTITYTINFYGSTFTQSTSHMAQGMPLPAFRDIPSYVKLTPIGEVPATVPASDLTLHYTATLDTDDGLCISTGIDAANAKPFGLKVDYGTRWMYADTDMQASPYVYAHSMMPVNETSDLYQWVLTGNWEDGYRLYNVGKEMYLRGRLMISDVIGTFDLIKTDGGWHFYSRDYNQYLYVYPQKNNIGLSLTTILSDEEAARCTFTAHTPEEMNVATCRGNVEAALDSRGNVFGLTDDAATRLQTRYDALIESGDNNLSTWQTLANDCATAPTVALTDGYYRIEEAQYGGWYLGYANLPTIVAGKDSANTVFRIDARGDGSYSIGIQGQYLQPMAEEFRPMVLGTDDAGHYFVRERMGKVLLTNRQEGYTYWCDSWQDEDNSKLVLAGHSDYYRLWKLVPAHTIEWPLHGIYSTLCLPYAVRLDTSSGVQAYTMSGITQVNGTTYASLRSAGNTLPAGTPVILYNENGATSLTLHITKTAEEAITGSYLSGQYIGHADTLFIDGTEVSSAAPATHAIPGDFILGDDTASFRPLKEGETIPDNSAFIPADKTNGADAIALDKVIWNSIGQVDADTASGDDIIYDLSGRRVQRILQKGIYIINGHKTVK